MKDCKINFVAISLFSVKDIFGFKRLSVSIMVNYSLKV